MAYSAPSWRLYKENPGSAGVLLSRARYAFGVYSLAASRWLPAIVLFALLGLAVLIYWPGLSGALVLDDWANLQGLDSYVAGNASWHQAVFGNLSGPLGRPVAMLSFLGNWITSGGHVWELKYTNLMIHLLCAVLVFWLSGRLLREAPAGVRRVRWWLALWTAAAWMFAPLMVSTVLYVVQRMTQLAALFVFAGLLCYVIGRQNLEHRFRFGATVLIAGTVVCWPLAVFSKENGALLPLLALVVEMFFFRFEGGGRTRRLIKGFFAVSLLAPAAAVAVKLALDPHWVTRGYADRDFTLAQRVMSEGRVLWDYVAQLLVPHGVRMGIYHDDYVKSAGLLNPPSTLVSIVAWALLLGVALWKRRSAAALILFGPVFFLAGQALESSVFPLELYFEHRNYLPAFGIFLSAGVALVQFQEWMRRRRMMLPLLVGLPLLYAGATYERALVWQTPESMELAAEGAHPDSARLHVDIANLYMVRGDLHTTLRELDDAQRLYARIPSGHVLHRLIAYCVTHSPVPDSEYQRLDALPRLDADSYTVAALGMLTDSVERSECPTLDVKRLSAALDRLARVPTPLADAETRWRIHIDTARLLEVAGHPAQALEHVNAAERAIPSYAAADLLAFKYRLALGDIAGARRVYQTLVRRQARLAPSHVRLVHSFGALLKELDATGHPAGEHRGR